MRHPFVTLGSSGGVQKTAPASPAGFSGNDRRMIYLSPVRWESYAQRPHFMVLHFLACGGRRVLWINPYPARLPRASDLRRSVSLHRQGTLPERNIEVIDFHALPIEPLPGGFAINRFLFGRQVLRRVREFAAGGPCILGMGKPSRLGLTLLRDIFPARSFYDAMDDFPNFHCGLSRAALARTEDLVSREVDHIFVSASALREKFAGGPTPVSLVPNAFDPGILPEVTGPAPTKVLGYLGSLGEWFDWQQVSALAAAVPAMEIHLCGPCLLPPPPRLPPNIRLFPPCRHSEAGKILQRFQVGLIPFRATPLTAGVDPIKYYEYRALGLPVISTRFGEMQRRGGEAGIFFFEDGIAGAIANALAYRPGKKDVACWREANSWRARFASAEPLARIFCENSTPKLIWTLNKKNL